MFSRTVNQESFAAAYSGDSSVESLERNTLQRPSVASLNRVSLYERLPRVDGRGILDSPFKKTLNLHLENPSLRQALTTKSPLL